MQIRVNECKKCKTAQYVSVADHSRRTLAGLVQSLKSIVCGKCGNQTANQISLGRTVREWNSSNPKAKGV